MNDEIKEMTKVLKLLGNKQASELYNYITNLQQELEEYKDTETYSKRFLYKANKDRLNANLDLVKENERLKELCDKYEEEHSNEFQCWKRDRKELLDKRARIEKAVEIINKYELIIGYYDYADEDGYWDTDSNNNLQKELKDTLNGKE